MKNRQLRQEELKKQVNPVTCDCGDTCLEVWLAPITRNHWKIEQFCEQCCMVYDHTEGGEGK